MVPTSVSFDSDVRERSERSKSSRLLNPQHDRERDDQHANTAHESEHADRRHGIHLGSENRCNTVRPDERDETSDGAPRGRGNHDPARHVRTMSAGLGSCNGLAPSMLDWQGRRNALQPSRTTLSPTAGASARTGRTIAIAIREICTLRDRGQRARGRSQEMLTPWRAARSAVNASTDTPARSALARTTATAANRAYCQYCSIQ